MFSQTLPLLFVAISFCTPRKLARLVQRSLLPEKIVEYFKRAQFEFCSSHSHPPANGAPLRYPAQAVTMQRRVIERTQAHVAGAECFLNLTLIDAWADSTWLFHALRTFDFHSYWMSFLKKSWKEVSQSRSHPSSHLAAFSPSHRMPEEAISRHLDPQPKCLPGEWSRGWKACGYRHRGWHAEHSGHSCCACQG